VPREQISRAHNASEVLRSRTPPGYEQSGRSTNKVSLRLIEHRSSCLVATHQATATTIFGLATHPELRHNTASTWGSLDRFYLQSSRLPHWPGDVGARTAILADCFYLANAELLRARDAWCSMGLLLCQSLFTPSQNRAQIDIRPQQAPLCSWIVRFARSLAGSTSAKLSKC
jgi:hypothetical protein